MTSRFGCSAATCALVATTLMVFGLVALAGATQPSQGGHRPGGGRGIGGIPPPVQLYGPTGPTPFNPAGRTPFNPAGPTPLNPAGPPPLGARVVSPRNFVPYQQPGMYVGVVGGGLGQAGSFYCQVHDRGYASQGLFLSHLADVDGVYGEDAFSFLVEDGGTWVFPAP
jgi:hypothetical protein